MGLFDKLLPSRNAVGLLLADPKNLSIVSPWASSSLARVALSDLTGLRFDEVTRADCMRVPAVTKARGLIVGHLSRLPLGVWQDEVQLPTPRWLTSTRTLQSPRMRLAWTLDDLIFTGLSLWALERDSDGITDAIRVPRSNWSVDPDSLGVLVNGAPVDDPDSVCLFEGIQEGFCTIAAAEVQGALDMSRAWRQRVESPVPLVELHQTDPNDELEDAEIEEAIADWEAARKQGGTAFTPPSIEAKMHGDVKTDLYTEGRNASRLDVANYLQVPASLLEGSQNTASLTYSTQEGRRNDFLDQCLAFWAGPIEARLSQDDITPDGTSVRFDFSSLASPTQPTSLPSSED